MNVQKRGKTQVLKTQSLSLVYETKRADEVAHDVLSIFVTFAAPARLQSDNGTEFCNQVTFEILPTRTI